MKSSKHSLAVVILAAGRSKRMKRPKLLLAWDKTSVLGHQICIWQALGVRQIAIVCAAEDDSIRAELDRLDFPAACRIPNLQPQEGMFSSIRCASQWDGWRPGLTHWAITLGDQPHLRLETLRALLKLGAAQPAKVCQPRRLGHLRHPVVLPKKFFLRLKDTSAPTLKEFLRPFAEDISSCEVDDPGLDLDIDEPQDYERALALHHDAERMESRQPASLRAALVLF
jgi:molybdenum cofactor cytidylyltransferase